MTIDINGFMRNTDKTRLPSVFCVEADEVEDLDKYFNEMDFTVTDRPISHGSKYRIILKDNGTWIYSIAEVEKIKKNLWKLCFHEYPFLKPNEKIYQYNENFWAIGDEGLSHRFTIDGTLIK